MGDHLLIQLLLVLNLRPPISNSSTEFLKRSIKPSPNHPDLPHWVSKEFITLLIYHSKTRCRNEQSWTMGGLWVLGKAILKRKSWRHGFSKSFLLSLKWLISLLEWVGLLSLIRRDLSEVLDRTNTRS